jgi:hypothetical protein
MKALTFEIIIKTDAKNLWHQLWDLENTKPWTNIFCAGGYFETNKFEEGEKNHLLTPSGEGMYSILETVNPYSFLAIKHINFLQDFKEIPLDESAQEWTNAIESYEIIPNEESCLLKVKVDTADAYLDRMNNVFSKALEILKKQCETLN